MKALKSKLAKEVLADKKASAALRRTLVANNSDSKFQFLRGAVATTVNVKLVPKARAE